MLRIPSNKELLTKEINFGKIFQFLLNLFQEKTLIETNSNKMNQNLFSLLDILEQLFKTFPEEAEKIVKEYDLPEYFLEKCLFEIPS